MFAEQESKDVVGKGSGWLVIMTSLVGKEVDTEDRGRAVAKELSGEGLFPALNLTVDVVEETDPEVDPPPEAFAGEEQVRVSDSKEAEVFLLALNIFL